ncbi:MAG: DUF3343 domain-containing protein [Ruminococcaceae bacterium]|nr:DUF3343 domain-containing protein [Oscillospiraceae bacterium]
MGKRNSQSCILALPSVTYAMRASELLKKYNISSRVISLEPYMTKKGCANGIELDCRVMSRARSILMDNNIPVSEATGGVYG